MRHLLFIIVASLIATPIVALQEQLSGKSGSNNSVQYQLLQTLDSVSKGAAQIYRTVENRVSVGLRELRD